jgi:hypothetical protein
MMFVTLKIASDPADSPVGAAGKAGLDSDEGLSFENFEA